MYRGGISWRPVQSKNDSVLLNYCAILILDLDLNCLQIPADGFLMDSKIPFPTYLVVLNLFLKIFDLLVSFSKYEGVLALNMRYIHVSISLLMR